jgi:hypothetical protein
LDLSIQDVDLNFVVGVCVSFHHLNYVKTKTGLHLRLQNQLGLVAKTHLVDAERTGVDQVWMLCIPGFCWLQDEPHSSGLEGAKYKSLVEDLPHLMMLDDDLHYSMRMQSKKLP